MAAFEVAPEDCEHRETVNTRPLRESPVSMGAGHHLDGYRYGQRKKSGKLEGAAQAEHTRAVAQSQFLLLGLLFNTGPPPIFGH